MNLVGQTFEHNLPLIQNMDQETLEWIKENKPFFGEEKITPDQYLYFEEQLKIYLPQKEWFLSDELFESIHGIRHILRVMANVVNLTISRPALELNYENCLIAASLHDLRRQNDRGDVGHGERSADWFLNNKDLVSHHYKTIFSENDLEEISTAISFHEIPYKEIVSDKKYLKNKEIVNVIKTADALDRYRMPKLKWWINIEIIKLIPTNSEKAFAYDLMVHSETKHLMNDGSITSVLSSLQN